MQDHQQCMSSSKLQLTHTYLVSAIRLLNKYMKNRDYIQNIYLRLLALGVAKNSIDFSLMCGRTPTWFSCVKSRDLPLTSQAALTLSMSVRERIDSVISDKMEIIAISDELLAHAGKMAKIKQQQHLGCPQ